MSEVENTNTDQNTETKKPYVSGDIINNSAI